MEIARIINIFFSFASQSHRIAIHSAPIIVAYTAWWKRIKWSNKIKGYYCI